jgi:hypothetical protein
VNLTIAKAIKEAKEREEASKPKPQRRRERKQPAARAKLNRQD